MAKSVSAAATSYGDSLSEYMGTSELVSLGEIEVGDIQENLKFDIDESSRKISALALVGEGASLLGGMYKDKKAGEEFLQMETAKSEYKGEEPWEKYVGTDEGKEYLEGFKAKKDWDPWYKGTFTKDKGYFAEKRWENKDDTGMLRGYMQEIKDKPGFLREPAGGTGKYKYGETATYTGSEARMAGKFLSDNPLIANEKLWGMLGDRMKTDFSKLADKLPKFESLEQSMTAMKTIRKEITSSTPGNLSLDEQWKHQVGQWQGTKEYKAWGIDFGELLKLTN